MFIDICQNIMVGVLTLGLFIIITCTSICAIKLSRIDFNKLFNNDQA